MQSNSWRVQWWYQGRASTTSFGSEEAARSYKVALRKRGIRDVVVSRV